jgi:hypothetical protein
MFCSIKGLSEGPFQALKKPPNFGVEGTDLNLFIFLYSAIFEFLYPDATRFILSGIRWGGRVAFSCATSGNAFSFPLQNLVLSENYTKEGSQAQKDKSRGNHYWYHCTM